MKINCNNNWRLFYFLYDISWSLQYIYITLLCNVMSCHVMTEYPKQRYIELLFFKKKNCIGENDFVLKKLIQKL